MSFRVLPLVVAATLVALLAGCSGETKKVKVSGRILDKSGVPLQVPENAYVTLQFVPIKGSGGHPATINRKQWTYEIELAPGTYRAVLFVPPSNFDLSKPSSKMKPPTDLSGGKPYDLTESRSLDLQAE